MGEGEREGGVIDEMCSVWLGCAWLIECLVDGGVVI